MKQPKYRRYDCLELTTVCESDSLSECDKQANEFFRDTGGECDLIIEVYRKSDWRYIFCRTPKITRATERYVFGD